MELYIHIPFCIRKCYYCDFLSLPCGNVQKGGRKYKEQEKYTEVLCAELAGMRRKYADRAFTSVFIGGGTPSVLEPGLMKKILEEVGRFPLADGDIEYTVECNPGTVDEEKLLLYKRYGVSRLSFGLQSAGDEELKRLGRIHCYEDFLKSYKLARSLGFENINVDLISALPGQHCSDWENTLRSVAELGPEHISAYSLIIEPGTPFFDIYGEESSCGQDKRPSGGQAAALPDEDEERKMYSMTSKILGEYGYMRYEISNYSKPGRESKHNIGYWTGEEYLGAGLGATSYIMESGEGIRYKNTDSLEEYLSCVVTEYEKCDLEKLSREDMMCEFMILGLRLTKGADRRVFTERFGCDPAEVFGDVIRKYEKLGLLKIEENFVALTEKGTDVSNIVMSDFLIF